MKEAPADLFEAFREDHAILGHGFYEIAGYIRARNLSAAKDRAERVDREAGAHIAFEQNYFYPALRGLLGDSYVDRLRREHDEGLKVIRRLQGLSDSANIDEREWDMLLTKSEIMEDHVAECGELFGTMGRFAPDEQQALLDQLLVLRQQAPRWTKISEGSDDLLSQKR